MSPSRNDAALKFVLRSFALFSAAILLLIVIFLIRESSPALSMVGASRFVTDERWSPAGGAPAGQFQIWPMMAASLLVTAGSVLLAVPLGIGTAVFTVFHAPNMLRIPTLRIIELLAGIPSVVYGLWGLVVLVPLIASWNPPGASLLAGIIVLAIMILPTVALLTTAALEQVPLSLIRSSAALGFSSSGSLRKVILPAARSGIATAIVLGVARAIGETMAVLMVCGNVIQMPESVFDPVRTLTANIALEMAYALDVHRSALFVSGLVLIAIVAALILCTEVIRMRERRV